MFTIHNLDVDIQVSFLNSDRTSAKVVITLTGGCEPLVCLYFQKEKDVGFVSTGVQGVTPGLEKLSEVLGSERERLIERDKEPVVIDWNRSDSDGEMDDNGHYR